MYKSDTEYANRYGDKYVFAKHADNQYRFFVNGGDDWCGRFGMREGADGVRDTAWFDPSGGPFVSIGDKIDGKEITSIDSSEDGLLLEVSDE